MGEEAKSLNDIFHALGRVEAKVDALSDLEVRVRGLEAWKSRAVGVVSLAAVVATGAVNLLWKTIAGGGGAS